MFRGRLLTSPRVVLSFVSAATRRVARLESNWPPRWGPTPHSADDSSLLRSPLLLPHRRCHWTFSLPSAPLRLPARPWSRLNALASLCTSRSRSCSPFANPLPLLLLLFPSIVSPYTRAQIFTRDRKWTCDRRRALCESTARVSIVLAVNWPAAGCVSRKVIGGELPEDRTSDDRAWILGTRQLTRSRRSSIDSLSRGIGQRAVACNTRVRG